MSEHCHLQSKSLRSLEAKLMEFTARRGLMRCLHPHEQLIRAKAVYFFCPRCEEKHGDTFMFDLPEIDAEEPPVGRHKLKTYPASIDKMTFLSGIKFKCGVEGHVQNGVFNYRCNRI